MNGEVIYIAFMVVLALNIVGVYLLVRETCKFLNDPHCTHKREGHGQKQTSNQ